MQPNTVVHGASMLLDTLNSQVLVKIKFAAAQLVQKVRLEKGFFLRIFFPFLLFFREDDGSSPQTDHFA